MPRPPNTSLRRQQIIVAFLGLMAQNGYRGTTMKALARACGLTQGLLHYHFQSKQDMLRATLKELEMRLEMRLELRLSARQEGSGAWQRLEDLIEGVLGLGEDLEADLDAQGAWLGIANEALYDEEVRGLYAETLWRLERRLEAAILACGPVRDAQSVAAAAICWMEGAWRVGRLAPGLVPRGSAAPVLRQFLRQVLGSDFDTLREGAT